MEQLKDLLVAFLRSQGMDDAAERLGETALRQTDSDLEVLFQLAKLAGGDQLLKNRVRAAPAIASYKLGPVLYKRARFAAPACPVDISTDQDCVAEKIYALVDPRFRFSAVSGGQFDAHYRKRTLLRGRQAARLPRDSGLFLAHHVSEHPACDLVAQRAGYTRERVYTTPLTDISAADFRQFSEDGPFACLDRPWDPLLVVLFLRVKRAALRALRLGTLEDVRGLLDAADAFIVEKSETELKYDLGSLMLALQARIAARDEAAVAAFAGALSGEESEEMEEREEVEERN